MATRKPKPQEERIPTQLVVGKDYFIKTISSRVEAGEDILKRNIQTYPKLEKAKK